MARRLPTLPSTSLSNSEDGTNAFRLPPIVGSPHYQDDGQPALPSFNSLSLGPSTNSYGAEASCIGEDSSDKGGSVPYGRPGIGRLQFPRPSLRLSTASFAHSDPPTPTDGTISPYTPISATSYFSTRYSSYTDSSQEDFSLRRLSSSDAVQIGQPLDPYKSSNPLEHALPAGMEEGSLDSLNQMKPPFAPGSGYSQAYTQAELGAVRGGALERRDHAQSNGVNRQSRPNEADWRNEETARGRQSERNWTSLSDSPLAATRARSTSMASQRILPCPISTFDSSSTNFHAQTRSSLVPPHYATNLNNITPLPFKLAPMASSPTQKSHHLNISSSKTFLPRFSERFGLAAQPRQERPKLRRLRSKPYEGPNLPFFRAALNIVSLRAGGKEDRWSMIMGRDEHEWSSNVSTARYREDFSPQLSPIASLVQSTSFSSITTTSDHEDVDGGGADFAAQYASRLPSSPLLDSFPLSRYLPSTLRDVRSLAPLNHPLHNPDIPFARTDTSNNGSLPSISTLCSGSDFSFHLAPISSHHPSSTQVPPSQQQVPTRSSSNHDNAAKELAYSDKPSLFFNNQTISVSLLHSPPIKSLASTSSSKGTHALDKTDLLAKNHRRTTSEPPSACELGDVHLALPHLPITEYVHMPSTVDN